MAAELGQILKQLEVPCTVHEDYQKGKSMVAVKGIKGNTVLFEEIPIVSWSFATRPAGTYCDWCMATFMHKNNNNNDNNGASPEIHRCPEPKCIGVYCSEDCLARSRKTHQFFCGPQLAAIRNFDLEELLRQNKKSDDDDDDDNENENEDAAKSLPQELEAFPITVEALAKSVATVAARYLAVATQYPDATSQQLFPLAAKLFNRLVSAPAGAEFDEIDASTWFATLRDAMSKRMLEIFDSALCGGSGDAADDASKTFIKNRNKEVVDALMSEDTLNVMLGQLTLNSQALNLPVPFPKRARNDGDDDEDEDEDYDNEDDEDDSGNENDADKKEKSTTKKSEQKAQTKFIRPSVGAGVFALHSTLNHSCDPNAFVSFSDNHEIAVKLRKSVLPGEEITITYIPELFLKLEKYEARRERLKNYFFKCTCARCVKEEKDAQEGNNKNSNNEKNKSKHRDEDDEAEEKKERSASEETL